jgi:hypothetical protein
MGKGDVLMRWASKLVAERAMQMKHALPNMDDSDIVDMLKGVPFARSKRASDRGTDIHDYLEQRMLGVSRLNCRKMRCRTGMLRTHGSTGQRWRSTRQN